MADVTVATYIRQAKRYLYTGATEMRDKLSVALDSDDTALTTQYSNTAIVEGARVSIGLEDMYVWVGGNPCTVERGDNGTTAEPHSVGDIVTISPRFSNAEILTEINNELSALSSPGMLFGVNSYQFITSTTWASGYNLPLIAPIDIFLVRARDQSLASREWRVVENWEVDYNANTVEFPSGKVLFLREPIPSSTTIRVEYKTTLFQLSSLSQFVQLTSLLPDTAMDIPILGAAIRLTAGREIRRNFDESQGDTRRAGEVGPGANLNSPAALRALYARRVKDEANRLARLYPTRVSRPWTVT